MKPVAVVLSVIIAGNSLTQRSIYCDRCVALGVLAVIVELQLTTLSEVGYARTTCTPRTFLVVMCVCFQ